ncbi:type II toxin-antitoxin system prevent-host-death family antitoxin [Salinarimonas sp. NSM]|uniref:type II toxin-antitoxin system prevent-host-death family antitoxin n=1 Tax=Salinarimonas sp. NSM TaxID=3458003 RepID=UPI004035929A
MQVGVDEAKERLEELLERAVAGEIVLIDRGPEQPSIFLTVGTTPEERARREAAIAEIQDSVRRKREAGLVADGPDAARCADYLYDDETGLPV